METANYATAFSSKTRQQTALFLSKTRTVLIKVRRDYRMAPKVIISITSRTGLSEVIENVGNVVMSFMVKPW